MNIVLSSYDMRQKHVNSQSIRHEVCGRYFLHSQLHNQIGLLDWNMICLIQSKIACILLIEILKSNYEMQMS